MTILLIAMAVVLVWSLLTAVCAPIVGRYLAKLDRNNRL